MLVSCIDMDAGKGAAGAGVSAVAQVFQKILFPPLAQCACGIQISFLLSWNYCKETFGTSHWLASAAFSKYHLQAPVCGRTRALANSSLVWVPRKSSNRATR